MRRIIIIALISSLAWSQSVLTDETIGKIKIEAFQNSQIMSTMSSIVDVYGGRLTGSPNYQAAAEWCVQQMNEWGITAELEEWGHVAYSWEYRQAEMLVTEPYPFQVIVYPQAFSAATKGVLTGTPHFVNISAVKDLDKYRGKLSGKIVFNGQEGQSNPHFTADALRYTAEELTEEGLLVTPNLDNTPVKTWQRYQEWINETDSIAAFFAGESIACLVESSSRDHGVSRLTSVTSDPDFAGAYPAVTIPREHFNRLYRLDKMTQPATVNIKVDARMLPGGTGHNVIAEIKGSDRRLKKEVVMLGAHLDSWHTGTGATDNGGNCATVMEVLRILKSQNIKPRRTIRIALWEGEEQGYLGSLGYIRRHFGDPATMNIKSVHQNLSLYLNLDGGCGKIRGLYLQGNEMARAFFSDNLTPFNYLGVNTITSEMVSYTDHISFNLIGLPGFDMIQDPIEYWSRTHHTNMDVYEAVIEEDVKINAAVLTVLALAAANRDEKIPRMPLPKVPEEIEE